MVGFGIGGITFKNHKYNEINEEFNKFKKETENEIEQKDTAKDSITIKAQKAIKENTELKKSNTRSTRNIELLQEQLVMALQKIEFLTNSGLKLVKEEKPLKERKTTKAKSNSKGAVAK